MLYYFYRDLKDISCSRLSCLDQAFQARAVREKEKQELNLLMVINNYICVCADLPERNYNNTIRKLLVLYKTIICGKQN